jgi:hypothetical protein
MIGHQTQAMTERYTGFQASDFADVTAAQEALAQGLATHAPL